MEALDLQFFEHFDGIELRTHLQCFFIDSRTLCMLQSIKRITDIQPSVPLCISTLIFDSWQTGSSGSIKSVVLVCIFVCIFDRLIECCTDSGHGQSYNWFSAQV